MNAPPARLRIATRASTLAQWQAQHVAGLLKAANPGLEVEILHVSTSGDLDQAGALTGFGGVGVFTREVQRAVLDGRADVAVHSLKDLPTEPVAGVALAAVPEREEPLDALVLPQSAAAYDAVDPAQGQMGGAATESAADATARAALDRLPPGARIGTGSPRRRAQLLHKRPDLTVEGVRGNVETRLKKLDAGQFDALVLAVAGLKRLGLETRIACRLGPPVLYPAVGQGALGIECRADDDRALAALARIDHAATRAGVTAERALLAELRAGCHAPLGAATRIEAGALRLDAVVLSPDGRERLEHSAGGPLAAATQIGRECARSLRSAGAERWLRSPTSTED